jgi:uncharacterized damage-inducible protein DinB
MEIQHRTNGATGALLDEYEKSVNELILIIQDISSSQLIQVMDYETKDEDCKSVQTILTHIVQSGYTYVIEIRKSLGEEIPYRDTLRLTSISEYSDALKSMFTYNEQLFEDYPDLIVSETDSSKKITVRWGQQYDVEQLIEHAIVHILKHRRQIEKFKLLMIKK